ncbi:MAG: Rho termination factor N-terminal domain-containing protein, partial [Mycobacterium sp.]
MTDTDLFTADESTDGNQPSNAVTTDTPDVKTNVSAGALSTMVLPELRALANQAGVKGTSGMRKTELIAAIKESRGQANGASASGAPSAEGSGESDTASAEAPAAHEQNGSTTEAPRRERRSGSREPGSAARTADEADREETGTRKAAATGDADNRQGRQQDTKTDERRQNAGSDQSGDQQSSGGQQSRGDDDGDGRGGRRGRRFRDRRRRGERTGEGTDTELREDDVVQPVAGILDVLDNYAFVRTSGYLAGPHDVYVSMNMVRKNGLRRGDAVTGAVRVPKEGEQPNQRQKFNPLVR